MIRPCFAEWLGTFFLLATVIGSGIMAENLAGGNVAIALLGNTIPTGAILYVLITMLGPVSGAHFNPAVTLVFLIRREIKPGLAGWFVIMQICGGLTGMMAAHLMFDLPIWQISEKARHGVGQWSGELIATFGLVATILACVKYRVEAVPAAVGLYITAAYWFTSSTSFANPAVTVARSFTNSFAGIQPADMPGFILCQLIAATIAAIVMGWLLDGDKG
ncbi:MAG: aquaporin family protein [Alphaproteobacteria bacterium]|nr:aquaporin family protein [Alphaproteobacteria bacterium]